VELGKPFPVFLVRFSGEEDALLIAVVQASGPTSLVSCCYCTPFRIHRMIKIYALGPRSPEAVAVQVTLTIPEELASRLRPFEEQLPRILELGLRQWNGSRQPESEGINDIMKTLARLP